MHRLSASILLFVVSMTAQGEDAIGPDRIRAAVERSLKRIETGAGNYTFHRACFSCHHQTCIPVFTAARERGFPVRSQALFLQTEFTRETFRVKLDAVVKGAGVGGSNTTVAYALMVLETSGQPPDDVTAALVQFLVTRQAKDGSWPATTERPPSEGSPFTNAALALRALKTYGKEDESLSRDERAKVDEVWKRSRDWLLSHEPKSMEDRIFHLRALVEAGADRRRIEQSRQALAKLQQKDGSWAQLPDQPGDAYATALALLTLHYAGESTSSAIWQNGAIFLLETQKPDGAWIVTTRSKPVQLFFDNGDPGGKSQFISMMATNWATLALLQALPAK